VSPTWRKGWIEIAFEKKKTMEFELGKETTENGYQEVTGTNDPADRAWQSCIDKKSDVERMARKSRFQERD
jgi:hypothetical protein